MLTLSIQVLPRSTIILQPSAPVRTDFRIPYFNECRCQYPRGLRPLACWDCGFESHRGHGCLLSVVSIVWCYSSRGVLPTAVRRCLWYRKLVNEEAMAHWGGGAVAPNKQTNKHIIMNIVNSWDSQSETELWTETAYVAHYCNILGCWLRMRSWMTETSGRV